MAPRINLPPLTRSLLVALIILTLLNAAVRPYPDWVSGVEKPIISTGDGAPYLAIVPGASIIYPYVFLLATLVEQNIFGLLVTGVTLFHGGRYLERAWSSQEFAKFMLFISTLPNIVTFLIYVFAFAISKNEAALNTTISGGIAIQAGYLVAFKQLVPEHTVAIAKGLIRMRVKHFPAIHLAANTISGLVFGTETAMFLTWAGFFTSWIYLRFYRLSPSLSSSSTAESADIRGDASDTFGFSFFFPEPLHTPIAAIGDKIYEALVAIKVCTPFSAEDIDIGNEQASARAEGGLPSIMNGSGRSGRGGGRREEAERRRTIALKALDQRLYATSTSKPQAPVAPPGSASMLGETNYEPERGDDIQVKEPGS